MPNKWEELETYLKNLYCLEKVMTNTVDRMKGYDYSFKQDVTLRRGEFKDGLLSNLIDDMLSNWKKMLRIRGVNPVTGEDATEPYTSVREELYKAYLYIVMRCSLLDATFLADGEKQKPCPDFAFVMEQIRRLSRDWCVIKTSNGSRKNVLLEGYGEYFGTHLYPALAGQDRENNVLDLFQNTIHDYVSVMTNDGNMKRMFIRIVDEDDIPEDHAPAAIEIPDFDGKAEYLANCEKFVTLFEQASPEIIHGFCADMDDIISSSLVAGNVPILLDTDKTLNIYGRVFDGPYQQAKKWAKHIQWLNG